MNGILTWFDCNSSFGNLRNILSDLHFHNTFQFVKYGASKENERKGIGNGRKGNERKWKEMEGKKRKERSTRKRVSVKPRIGLKHPRTPSGHPGTSQNTPRDGP